MSYRPYSWNEFVWGVIIMSTAFSVLTWITIGILFAVNHPEPPMTKEEKVRSDFVINCRANSGVPDTHTDEWTCKR